MEETKKKTNRGGWREGSGRKRIKDPKETKPFRFLIELDLVPRLEEHKPKCRFINEAIREKLDKEEE